jgi:hypothetical protein
VVLFLNRMSGLFKSFRFLPRSSSMSARLAKEARLVLSPQRGFVHTLSEEGKCAVRNVPCHAIRLLRCALIGIAQSLSFEGEVRL